MKHSLHSGNQLYFYDWYWSDPLGGKPARKRFYKRLASKRRRQARLV